MKIDGPTGPRAVNPRGKPGANSAVSSDQFEAHLSEDVAAAPVETLRGAAPVNPLLALQEVEDQGARREQAKERGNRLLDRLDQIRHDLLIGTIPPERLGELIREMQTQRANLSDPRLIEILDEIDLRAQVELAKLARG